MVVSSLGEQRVARNEALFREVNEAIAELEERLGAVATAPVFVCECANPDCHEQLPDVDLAVYERTRANPRRFFVAPGHQNEEFEQVVERHPNFLIVEKTGGAGAAAAAEEES